MINKGKMNVCCGMILRRVNSLERGAIMLKELLLLVVASIISGIAIELFPYWLNKKQDDQR